MTILKSIDIEEEVRKALRGRIDAYCRPLPADYVLPSVLITQTGGTQLNRVDTFSVAIDARAHTEADASDTLRTAEAVLLAAAKMQTTAIRHVEIISSGSWGRDPARPDLAMCSAMLRITCHPEKMEV